MTDTDSCSIGCGHCICTFKYNDQEYYYDSMRGIKTISCDDDEILLPCALIKKKWTDDLLNFCFSIKDFDPFDFTLDQKDIFIQNSHINCYKPIDALYCFVKNQ